MNFDAVLDRKNTGSMKWDMMEKLNKPKDVLPLWVADMDFKAPDGVIQVLEERIKHGVFGYTKPTSAYYNAIINWMEKRHDWKVKKESIVATPGIVPVLNFIIQEFTQKGDGVLIQRPVYHPFSKAIIQNDRTLINSPLVLNENRYEIDFLDFENKIRDNQVKLFILCSPHNPVGRVWTNEELKTMGDICIKHNVLILVDEIHHDLVFKSYKHIPFASLGQKYANYCITCTAPSKTFNLAGLKVANIIIDNQEILDKFKAYLQRISLMSINMLGISACEAAYQTGGAWLDGLMDYIDENKKYVKEFIEEKFSMINVIDSEATYLLWIDFRNLGLTNKKLEAFMLNEAKLWLNDGYIFGEEGSGFQRMNIACPRSTLVQALKQLEQALQKLI